MLKSALIAIVFFGGGFVFAKLFYGDTPSVANSNPVVATEITSNSAVKANEEIVPAKAISNPSTIGPASVTLNPKTLSNPESSYDAFRILVSLDAYSAEALKDVLLDISKDKKELRLQVAFLLVSKYPQEGYALLGDALNQNDSDLATYILQSSAQSNPQLAWEWLQKNESDFDKLYTQDNVRKTFKMQILAALSKKPEYKSLVTEEIQRLAQAGTNLRDNYRLETINKNIANSDPEASINTALASNGGKIDKDLFKGGVLAIADKDLTRAKDLILQHTDFADESLIRQISKKMVEKHQFKDVNLLVNKLTDVSSQRTTASILAHEVSLQGMGHGIEFINALEPAELKIHTAMALSNYMSLNDQSVKEQLALFDEALKNIPIDKKAFSYAYTINKWSKNDASASAQYLTELASSNKPLSEEVQKALARMKG